MLAMVNLEDFVPADHPVRRIGTVVEAALADLDGELGPVYNIIQIAALDGGNG